MRIGKFAGKLTVSSAWEQMTGFLPKICSEVWSSEADLPYGFGFCTTPPERDIDRELLGQRKIAQ